MTIVGIHQPNFFPWLGYFTKIARSDRFLILDDAQNSKTGGSWLNRVRLRISGQPRWLTAPIARPAGLSSVDDVRFARAGWQRKALGSIRASYAKAPHFAAEFPRVEALFDSSEERVARFNEGVIRRLAADLGLEAEVSLASALGVESTGTDRLVRLVAAAGGSTYLSGDGSDGYLQPEAFQEAGLELTYLGFQHPRYDQGEDEFAPGLSILDALFHVGLAETARLVQGG